MAFDPTAPLKSETFRPMVSLLLPGVTALAPYVLLASHYNPAIDRFAHDNTGIYLFLLTLAALALGFILEDLGSRLEVLVWDRLIEKETGCHSKDWYAFLNLAPETEKIGHRYLRTITLRLKFELAFGLSLLLLCFGLLWLDSVEMFWTYGTTVRFSAVILALASYCLWESYGSVWVLARLRHLIIHGKPCTMEPRPEDLDPWKTRYDLFLVATAVFSFIFGIVLLLTALFGTHEVGRDSGFMTGLLMLGFAFVLILSWWWFVTETDARGRRRGISLRLALSFALLALFVYVRIVTGGPPLSWPAFWVAIVFAASNLFFARKFWAGSARFPSAHQEQSAIIPDAL
jgi:hypothetical protein